MEASNKNDTLCPSYVTKPGAQLFGIVNANGFINYLENTLVINESFIEEASKGKDPGARFRFAGNCAKSGCNHWDGTGHQCGLINTMIALVGNEESEALQHCPIRAKCRWYAQQKGLACAQCNEIIRNIETKMVALE